MANGARARRRAPVQVAALVVGILFLIVAALGFVPGITTSYDEMQFAGPDSRAELLGLFQVSVLHNLVHLLLGVFGLILSRPAGAAVSYLLAGGVVYIGLWAYGLVVDMGSAANVVPVDHADNWLHLGLGAGMIILGLLLPGGMISLAATRLAKRHGR